MLADLQIHTVAGSPDSDITPQELGELAIEAGLGAVGITEHLSYDPAELRTACQRAGVIALTGREISYCGAHLLVFAEDETLLETIPRVATGRVDLLQAGGVLTIWAHPSAPSGSSAYSPLTVFPQEVGDVVDAVEVLNGRHLHFADAIASAEGLAKRLGLGTTGGSDAHIAADVGKVATWIEGTVETQSDLIEAIRAGRTRAAVNSLWWNTHGYSYRSDLEEYAV